MPEADDQASLRAASGGSSRSYVVPDTTLGQDQAVPLAPGQNGWRGDPALETYVGDRALGQDEAGSLGSMGSTGGHRLDLESSGAYVAARETITALDRQGGGPDDNAAQGGHLVAHSLTATGFDASEDGTGRGTPIVPVPHPTGGQELAATLKGQRGKGGGGVGPEETLLPQGFINTESMSSGDNVDVSPTLRVENYASVAQPYSKRHAASDGDDAETWDESEQAHTLNQNMNAPDLAADAQAVRRLTPTEAERLQGVPDGWTLPYGPSLADAPAWHDLRNPPLPVRAVTINEGNDSPQGSVWESDQCGSLATGGGKPGQGYHAVRTEPADPTWIGLDNANRGNDHVREGQPSAEALRAKGTLDQAVSFQWQSGGDVRHDVREGEAGTLQKSQTQAVGFYPNNNAKARSDGERVGESPTLSGGGGGNTPAVAYDPLSSPPLTAAGFHGNADGSDDQVEATALAFEARYYSDRERMGGAPSAESGPVKATDSKAGDAAQVVAFAQNQRDEVRELDDASSLSGQGTHQTTYVAGAAVADGLACPYDCPPDGPRYAALGDAVTAPVARWIGERLVDVLRERGVIAADGAVDLDADLG